jgi:hypothetical protein
MDRRHSNLVADRLTDAAPARAHRCRS